MMPAVNPAEERPLSPLTFGWQQMNRAGVTTGPLDSGQGTKWRALANRAPITIQRGSTSGSPYRWGYSRENEVEWLYVGV
jgi:hypothetical protein